MKIVAYLRCSTEQQGDSKHGLNAQHDACAAAGASMFFQDIVSGASGLESRPGLLQAIASLDKGDVLLVKDRSRLGRDSFVIAMIEASVARHGAAIQTADGLGNGDTPADKFIRQILDAINEYELELIRARTKASLQGKKKRNERVGYIPYGYMLDVDGIHLIENPAEQRVIQLVHQLRKSGMSLRAIAEYINNQSVNNRRGEKWHYSSVNRLLKKVA